MSQPKEQERRKEEAFHSIARTAEAAKGRQAALLYIALLG